MNRIILLITGLFSVSSLLLVDSAVKGTALLALAAVAAIILRRDSAATRHLIWLLAIVAMLVVPALSAVLPQWRVLPEWTGVASQMAVVAEQPRSSAGPAQRAVEFRPNAQPAEFERPSATAHQAVVEPPDARHAPVIAKPVPVSPASSWNWISALPIVWAIGFSALILRLLAARLILWNSELRGTTIPPSSRPANAADSSIVTALEAARSRLGLRQAVTLLIHPDKTIPVVWGIVRCRLLLPEAARDWSAEQLRSVLLHELAHVKRRDTTAQLLAQIACALHWFNPLVWLAAWRLNVERERACDDLVLSSGVRPSAYAGHLLQAVTGLAPARWTQSCGLAMARGSSIESRLIAVLSENLNRRGVSMALSAIALAMAASIAVPVAMLRAADEKPGEQTKPTSAETKPDSKAMPESIPEEHLRWGEPVNGLRAALAIHPEPGEPKAGDKPELYLVVQNVSKAPIRLCDASVPPNVDLHVLYVKTDGKTQMGLGAREPVLGDLTIKPGESAQVLMFLPRSKAPEGKAVGPAIATEILKNDHQTMVADMEIQSAPAGAWTGKLVTGETTGAAAAGRPQPRNKAARALFNLWQGDARANGNIPGGLVGRLGDKVKEFIHNNIRDASGFPYARDMAVLAPRLYISRDWAPGDIMALMDDIAAVTPIPLETTMEEAEERAFKPGAPLPPDLANAPWGEAQPNGLRMAWLLEPRAAEHRIGTPLESRILVHNAGKSTVVFRMRTWHQVGLTARDAKGAAINVESTEWLTLGRLMAFRVAPGEFVEATGPGVGVGANRNNEAWQNTGVGSWVQAKEGDEVTWTTNPVPLSDWNEAPSQDGDPAWWLGFVAARLECESPLPADAAERTRLLDRAVHDLCGAAPTAEETAAFIADREPTALDSLAKRLAKRPGITPFTGSLTSGPTKFHVLPLDPDAAKKPRTASNPGQYTLGDNAVLVVTRRPDGERIVNEASIKFFFPDPSTPAGEPHPLKLPDGYDTWAAAWTRGAGVLWLREKAGHRCYDFTDPAHVKETTYEDPASLEKVPKPILDALHTALNVPDAPRPATETPK